MNSLRVRDYIDTVAALNQLVQRKRFHLDEEVDYVLDSPMAASIIQELKIEQGLDLALIDSDGEWLQYGEYLQSKLNSVISEFYFNSSLNEEIELLEVIKECSIEDYLSYDFDDFLNTSARDAYNPSVIIKEGFVRDTLSAIGVTVPSFLFSIKHPEKVHLVDLRSGDYPASGVKHYLVSSKLKIKNKDVFVLTDLVQPFDKPSKLYARSCFFFKQSNKRVNSPARMFLQGINEYGNEINLEGVKKHFFLQKKINNTQTLVKNGLSYKKEGYRGKMSLFFTIARRDGNMFYQFSYMILKDEIIADVKKGIFL